VVVEEDKTVKDLAHHQEMVQVNLEDLAVEVVEEVVLLTQEQVEQEHPVKVMQEVQV
jgi:hypothetical protein